MRQKGITLIELTIVLAILGIILTAILQVYLTILKSYKRETSISYTNIEKLISLELMRKDIEMAGFGVPKNIDPIGYNGSLLTIRSTVLFKNDSTKCFGYSDYNGLRLFSLDSADISSTNCYNTNFCYLKLDTDYTLEENCTDITSLPTNGTYLLFGVLDYNNCTLSQPYNQIEYSLSTTGLLSTCAPNTFELAREEVKANGITGTAQPILDCVKEFKVAFGLDTNGDGNINSWSTTLPTGQVRDQVREVRVLILYHEGKRDMNFTYNQGTIYLNATSTLQLASFTPVGDELHYRWKLIRFSVTPMNLRRASR